MQKLLFLIALLALPALAVDGVREINQACVVFGCFSGDSGGFPITIDEPGSYRLTSNLDVTVLGAGENRTAIDVMVSQVTLDLNGFSIIGPASCTGNPVTSCSPSGTGIGIQTAGTAQEVVITNGWIRGMGFGAVACSGGCRITHLTVTENASFGISNANDFGHFSNNIARRNGGDGFFLAGHVSGNVARGNSGRGIFTNPRSVVIGNQSLDNGGDGIRCFTCSLLDNVVSGNMGFGVDFGGNSVYGRNLIEDNDMGQLDGSAFAVDANRCGLAACP